MGAAFFVPGIPQAQGSIRAFAHKHTGKVIATSTNKNLKGWRQTVALYARKFWRAPATVPMQAVLQFYLPRPKTVDRDSPSVKPDLDKLVRAVFDALTGIAYLDDAQVIKLEASKEYGIKPGVKILVLEIL